MADGILTELNLIDIFGYMIPGALLLTGVIAPLKIPFVLPTSEIAGLTLGAVFAFTLGLAISGVGRSVRGLTGWWSFLLAPSRSARGGAYDANFRYDLRMASEYAKYEDVPEQAVDTGFHGSLLESYPAIVLPSEVCF